MPTNNVCSFIMAQRLKELRTKKELSHETLRKALIEKYKIDISVDSLKNYEVLTPHHKKAYKNLGMRVEYLTILADFYGVSTDYILGKTAAPDPIPAAVDDLGFSPRVIDWLRDIRERSEPDENDYVCREGLLQRVNTLFENDNFKTLVEKLCNLMDGIDAENLYYSLPWDNRSKKIEAITSSGKHIAAITDLLKVQDLLCDGQISVLLPDEHAFGVNVTEILQHSASQCFSRLLDSLHDDRRE